MLSEFPSRRQILWSALGFEGGLAALAYALGRLRGGPTWHVAPTDLLLGAAASLPMLVVFLICVRWPAGPLRQVHEISRQFIRPLFQSCTIADLALISLLAGIGEEWLFRGVIQEAASDWAGLWAGLVLASVLFGLMHPLNRSYVVLATGMGAYLGWLWIESRSLAAIATAHGLYDFLALVALTRTHLDRSEM
jgi:membrane protease YdiL (CAAX protease family)